VHQDGIRKKEEHVKRVQQAKCHTRVEHVNVNCVDQEHKRMQPALIVMCVHRGRSRMAMEHVNIV
jgi:hypothetical protein